MTRQTATEIAERMGIDLNDPDLKLMTTEQIVDCVRQIPWTGEGPANEDELSELHTALQVLGF